MAFSDSWILFLAFLAFSMVDSEPPSQDKQALLSFLSGVPHARRLQWNSSDSVCNWVGVGCNENKSDVYYLRLPAIGLVGEIPDSTLGNLIQLRVLSLRSNKLSGSIPSDFSNLKFLRYLYLQENQLSGEFPLSVSELTGLTRLDLSNNEFTGSIPVINLSQLTGLFLQNNGFSGPLPSINSPGLTNFNVSNNHLNGTIPTTLVKFSENSFAGNIGLCGGPLPPCNPISPSPSPSTIFSQPPPNQNPPSKKSRSLSRAAIIGISVAAGVLALILLLSILFICFRRMKKQKNKAQKPTSRGIVTAGTEGEADASTSKDDVTGGSASDEKNKLIFIKGSVYSFDLEDLLRASAEVLGKGSLGTSYKAVLEEGTTVVVKRLKDVAANKKDFEQQMVLLGKIKHENVLPLRAYYYSRDEKLLVSDYLPSGSLSSMLHGSRGSGRTPLNWENRMKIAVAAARGLAYLHVSDTVHGNIKSSNVLIGQDNNNATVSDYGLNPVFSNSTPSNHRAAGYRAPEVIETRKVTFKSDIYGYGVLLLELLTGKAPNQTSLGEEGIDLPRWVQSVVREEWTAEVFDVELMRYNNGEEEMVQLLQVGMACVATVPDQRPVMSEVVRMVEDIHRGDEQQPSSDDPSKGSSGQTPPPEISTVTP